MQKLVSDLTKQNLTISSAESLTGGLFASKIVEVSGASAVFKGAIVAYSLEIKEQVLKVDNEILIKYGALSRECVSAMAQNVAKLMNSDIGVSFSGNAGPNISENKPVGCVYLGLYYKDSIFTKELRLTGSRQAIREACISEMRKYIVEILGL